VKLSDTVNASSLSDAGYSAAAGDYAIPSASAAISQGSSLLNQASTLGAGSYAGMAAAAEGLVDDLPSGAVGSLAKSIAKLAAASASGAALGATIGSAIPILGNVIGAEVGAVVGAGVAAVQELLPLFQRDHWNPVDVAEDLIVDVFNLFGLDESSPPQNEYRFSAERVCFPAAAADYAYGIIPGFSRHNPRSDANSTFYQSESGLSKDWSDLFSFTVTWFPVQGTTATTRQGAWLLAQVYVGLVSMKESAKNINAFVDNVLTKGVKSSLPVANLFEELVGAYGQSAKKARTEGQNRAGSLAMLKNLFGWYGHPSSFSWSLPYATSNGAPSGFSSGVSQVEAALVEYAAHPIDYTYYPLPTEWNASAKEWTPAAKNSGENDCNVTADPTLCGLSEIAFMGQGDASAFHYAVFLADTWKKLRALDAKDFPGLSTAMHPNFARVVGLIAAKRKASAKALQAKKLAAAAVQVARANASQRAAAAAHVATVPAAQAALAAPSGGFAVPSLSSLVTGRAGPFAYATLGLAAAGVAVAWRKTHAKG
jgi:hypothetical protein